MRQDVNIPNGVSLEEIERKENGFIKDAIANNIPRESKDPPNEIKKDGKKRNENMGASEAFSTLLRHVGGYGKWQWKMLFIASFCGNFTAFHNLGAGESNNFF